MTIPLSQPVADRIYQSLVSGYDAAEAQGQGAAFLSKLVVLLAAEVAVPERVIELINLANHHPNNTNQKREI